MSKFELIPLLNACDFEDDMENELAENEISTHYQNEVMHIDWDEEEEYPETKKWLLDNYGEEAKNYKSFGISAT